jgi:hypothetical protein
MNFRRSLRSIALLSSVVAAFAFSSVAMSDVPDAAVGQVDAGTPQEICGRMLPLARKLFQSFDAKSPQGPSPKAFETANLEEMRQNYADLQSSVNTFKRCLPYMPSDAGASAQESAKTEAWIRAVNAAIDTETKCRATPQCLADRARAKAVADALASVCGTIDTRARAAQDMTRERANPSGVVDLKRLHDLGQVIQALDAQLPGLKAQYATVAHRPFAATMCPQ